MCAKTVNLTINSPVYSNQGERPMTSLPQTPQQSSRTAQLEKKLLFSRIQKLESLPLPSYSMLELSAILKNQPADFAAIAATIGHDHVVLAQLWRLFYKAYPNVEPTSAQAAVEMLPEERLKSLLYVPRMLDSFDAMEEMEWNHSYTCRILMESILEDNGIVNPQLILAAHLHDIGKNVFRDWSPKKYKIVEKHAESSKNVPLYKLETAVLQTNHAEVGAELLKAWGFAEPVWKVVAQHHNHEDQLPEEYLFETALLQFVNYIDCRVREIPCDPPTKKLMNAARIAEIDESGYIGTQRALIEKLRAGNAGAIRKNMMNELIAAESAAQILTGIDMDPCDVNEEEAELSEIEKAAAEITGVNLNAGSPEEEEEEMPKADPETYHPESVPASISKREEELLHKMGLK